MLQLAVSKAKTAYTGTSCGYACPPSQSCTSVYTRIAVEQLLPQSAPVYAVLEALRGVNVCLATSNSGS